MPFGAKASKMSNKRHVLQVFRECISPLLKTLFYQGMSMFLKTTKVHHGMLENLMLFNNFECLLGEGTPKWAINNMFYKGSASAFHQFWKHCFHQGISRLLNAAKVHHGVLINLKLFNDFECLFANWASKWSRNDRFYKGSEMVFYSVRESKFPKEY